MRHDSITPGSDRPVAAERTSPTVSGTVTGPDAAGGLLFSELASRYLANRELIGLKRTTLMDYESYTRVHLVPAFGAFELEAITIELIEEFIAAKRQEGKAVKSILNYLGLLHAMFAFAVRRGWCARNPVALVEKPRGRRNLDIRFLDVQELEALLAATPTDERGTTERVLYLTAAMTGLRRGELLALRWQDIDWTAGVVRVRRNYTRGQFGTPKSRRSSRAVPLAQRVRDELRAALRAVALPGPGRPRLLPPRSSASCSTRQSSANASRPQPDGPGSDRSAFTICATPSAPAWPPPARPCDGSRNGSDTATTARPRSTPTTHPTSPKPPTGPHAPSTTPRPTATQRPPLTVERRSGPKGSWGSM